MSQQTFSAEVMRKREALDRVRRRVASIILIAVTEHGVFGLIVVAQHIIDDPGRRDNAIGLLVMSAVISILTYIGVRIIVQGRMLSPWLLVALAPPIAGAVWVL